MKRLLSLCLAIAILCCFCSAGAEEATETVKPRILITTDLEVDDMNGILLTLMYANDFDIAGIVWTAGKFHFSGDGQGTLFGDVIKQYPDYEEGVNEYPISCEATTVGGTVNRIEEVTQFRPSDPTFLDRTIRLYYAEDYKLLSQNAEGYPTPEYLLSVTKVGNIQFEGDYREETEGSQLIYDAIMDDDPRPLIIQHWGGINTTVRALQSIYEDYYGTDQWAAVCDKVVEKVRISGTGEDNCWKFSKMAEKFPGIKTSVEFSGWSGFGNYFMACTKEQIIAGNGNAETLPYYQSDFLANEIKFDHGRVLSTFHLMYDGQVLYGEHACQQYGLKTYMDWSETRENGFAKWPDPKSPAYSILSGLLVRVDLDPYDWMCSQFATAPYVNIGLRTDVSSHSDPHYTVVMFEDLASRADWAVCTPENCNHAPVVTADVQDFKVKAGDAVILTGSAIDPDGNELSARWWIPSASCSYIVSTDAEQKPVFGDTASVVIENKDNWNVVVTVPDDALPGSSFVVNLEVTDLGVEHPMSRFAQYVLTIE